MIFKTKNKEFNDDMDIVKMKTDVTLIDKNGNIIEIKVPRPEYSSEIFS